MRSQSGLALLVLVLTVAALALISMHSSVGKTELINDRALLNPLNMMKQIAAINKWTDPEQQTAAQVPKRAVLEAQVAARQQASRDKATLVAEAHTEAREGRHASKASTEFADKKVGNYEKQAQTLTEQSEEDSVTASELATKAQELDAEVYLCICAHKHNHTHPPTQTDWQTQTHTRTHAYTHTHTQGLKNTHTNTDTLLMTY